MVDDRRDSVRRQEDQDMAIRIDELEQGQERLFSTLLGPNEQQLDGSLRRRKEQGMEFKVDAMYQAFTNGGVKIRLPAGAWVAIVVAIIGGVSTVAAALFGG